MKQDKAFQRVYDFLFWSYHFLHVPISNIVVYSSFTDTFYLSCLLKTYFIFHISQVFSDFLVLEVSLLYFWNVLSLEMICYNLHVIITECWGKNAFHQDLVISFQNKDTYFMGRKTQYLNLYFTIHCSWYYFKETQEKFIWPLHP